VKLRKPLEVSYPALMLMVDFCMRVRRVNAKYGYTLIVSVN
jgi:hypothetical protein